MRSDLPSTPKRDTVRRRGPLRLLADSERGFTIIEVVVSAIIVASIAGAAASALLATTRMSADQRRHGQADAIAQQDQERLRGMTIKALSNLVETRTTPVYDGTAYTVRSTGGFLSSTGSASCSTSGSGAAAYVLIRSEVNWQANMKPGANVSDVANWSTNSIRPPVVQESLITPNAGGTLLASVVDQDNQPLAGATIAIAGKEFQDATTGAGGCAVLAPLTPGPYYVWATRSGYVDPNGNDDPIGGVAVTATGTSFPTPNPFRLGLAGLITAHFRTSYTLQGSATNITGQKAPSISWRDNQSGMSASKNVVVPGNVATTPVQTPQILFPFNTGTPGVYTNNYAVWAGSCDTARPPTGGNLSNVTVSPGGTPALDGGTFNRMRLPALLLNAHWRPNATTAYAPVTPAHIMITDACGQSWYADVRPGTTYPKPGGELAFPGQPYAPNVTGQKLTVCVDYRVNGSSPYYRATTTTHNTDFTNGTLVPTLQIDGAGTPNQQCLP
jgi:prepilin-type N-terminal cleavage/methylation domain-containing protein